MRASGVTSPLVPRSHVAALHLQSTRDAALATTNIYTAHFKVKLKQITKMLIMFYETSINLIDFQICSDFAVTYNGITHIT